MLNKYLAGIEQIEGALIRKTRLLQASKARNHMESPRKNKYLMMYITGILTCLSSILLMFLEVVESVLLRKSDNFIRKVFRSPRTPDATYSNRSLNSLLGLVEVRIANSRKPGSVARYQLGRGETVVLTQSTKLAVCDDIQVVTIPDSSEVVPVSIRIRPSEKTAKLIYQSSHRRHVRIFRRFGLDEVPVRLSENLNLSTDRIVIQDSISVFFTQDLVRAQSAPSL
jgi:hypothetical protein